MKKLLYVLLVPALVNVLVSCGASEEEKKKQEQEAIQFADSLKNAAKADIAKAMDSLKNETGNKDSLVKVETQTEEKTK